MRSTCRRQSSLADESTMMYEPSFPSGDTGGRREGKDRIHERCSSCRWRERVRGAARGRAQSDAGEGEGSRVVWSSDMVVG